jgi:2,4-dienoyl-CoA reductase-like NADH-dependent reductase (Old Yellow Enzyme family)
MSILFSPLTIKDITLRNRIAISPMCMYTAVEGFANDWHLVHYGSRATGGAGLIIQEATAVSEEGRISAGDLGLYKEEHIGFLQRITTFIDQQGCVAGIQLAHAGRKGFMAIVAPSALSFSPDFDEPRALDGEGIQKVISDFRIAALRALKAGYKLIEIHAAHGYLVHQFLSPLSNHRTDQYGGSFENRIRLLLEIVNEIKCVWPENLPLFVRISATDWAEGGWDVDEAVKLASILRKKGVDLIDSSSGGLVPYQKIPVGPGYQVPFAERIKAEANILTAAVGLITNGRQAEDILQKGQADLILIARESLRDPYFALNAAKQLNEDFEWPRQYLRAK